MSDELCTCCELPLAQCGKAAEVRQRAAEHKARTDLLAKLGWFESRYDGKCSQCGEWFKAGDPIHRGARHDTWISSCCA